MYSPRPIDLSTNAHTKQLVEYPEVCINGKTRETSADGDAIVQSWSSMCLFPKMNNAPSRSWLGTACPQFPSAKV